MSTNAKPFESPVIMALDATAKHRWSAAEPAGAATETEPGDIGRTFAAVIESTAAKIAANDFSGVETAFAAQALALDKTLLALKNPHASKNSRDRTIETVKIPGGAGA